MTRLSGHYYAFGGVIVMRSAVFVIPVWIFALGALWIGVLRNGSDLGTLYVGLGALGVCIANVLMIQHRRISDLERRLGSETAETKK
jgi:hypothetical protein